MDLYMPQAKDLIQQFRSYKVIHIKRSENNADALSKLASTNFDHLAVEVRIEVLETPLVTHQQLLVIQTGVTSWMTPIKDYLSSRVLPDEKAAAQKIRYKALHNQLLDRILYRRSFVGPLLWCANVEDADYLIREIHEGICGVHTGRRMVVAKVMNAGYYWPGMHMDAVREIRKSDSCQHHSPNVLWPKNELVPVTAMCSFQNGP
ncbi:uncharacterized protein LOC143594607 [Bidens hawaiensis]|uniref:uncharacterized protein LOC143594607 n=1 Tax=Bidens hawaiensis TaxID=980011 RepID=UPI004049DA94